MTLPAVTVVNIIRERKSYISVYNRTGVLDEKSHFFYSNLIKTGLHIP